MDFYAWLACILTVLAFAVVVIGFEVAFRKINRQARKAQKRAEEEKREKQRRSLKRQDRGRQPIPDDVKVFVWRRDEGRCVNCGSRENLEFDHIIPVSKGGSNTARNIQLLCERCNRSKGDSLVSGADGVVRKGGKRQGVSCPYCGETIYSTSWRAGEQKRCFYCQKEFLVSEDQLKSAINPAQGIKKKKNERVGKMRGMAKKS